MIGYNCKTISSLHVTFFLCSFCGFLPLSLSVSSGIGELLVVLTGFTDQLFLFTILCVITISANMQDVSLSLIYLSLLPISPSPPPPSSRPLALSVVHKKLPLSKESLAVVCFFTQGCHKSEQTCHENLWQSSLRGATKIRPYFHTSSGCMPSQKRKEGDE